MERGFLRAAEKYMKANRRRKLRYRIVSVLACAVVFCTTYAMILPAITLEQKTYCGYEEHSHNEDCYERVLVCGQEENAVSGHIHSEDCYDENSELVCGLEETETESVHNHTDECYETVLKCEKTEHTHSSDCYSDTEEDKTVADDSSLQENSEYVPETTAEESETSVLTVVQAAQDEELNADFCYKTSDFTLTLHINGTISAEATEASEQQSEDTQEKVYTLDVTVPEENDEYYTCFSDYMEDTAQTGELLNLSVLEFRLCDGDKEIDLSSCTVTAEITPKAAMVEEALETVRLALEEDEETAAEIEPSVVLSVMQADKSGCVTKDDTALLTADTSEMPVLQTSDLSGNVIAFASSEEANPSFNVQYYANLDIISRDSTSSATTLSLIDTSGGVLPQNGTTPSTINIDLTETATSGIYKVATYSELTEVFTSHTYEYTNAPNLDYFNILSDNASYDLKEIWFLKEDKDKSSTDENDWDVYGTDVSFTNNADYADEENIIVITDNTVIRLVYETTSGSYTNTVNMYDYDITEDGEHTYKSGINNPKNYSGKSSDAKLAFGNENTGTGMYNQQWTDSNGITNYINKKNRNGTTEIGYKYCVFGLVTGLKNSILQYADGISAPNLFNEGDAIGKRSFDNGEYCLNFTRQGDTYTLSSVVSANYGSIEGLQYFEHPVNVSDIWTNNFWPMDGNPGTDGLTGATGNTGTYINSSGSTKSYPTSDDGKNHNNMFGMLYAVQFTITADYVGPLEYVFNGDNDMWFFLDDELICDIGGIHSAVGEYVNLWDYIKKGESGTHTLSFFYTERGLSGSTCYMQFTLPSVTSATPGQSTGSVLVEKEVSGTAASSNTDREFKFKLTLKGNGDIDIYSTYIRVDAEGNLVSSGNLKSGDEFKLKAGEHILITGLPDGIVYEIEETDPGGADLVSCKAGDSSAVYSNSVTGTINVNDSSIINILFNNRFSYRLPDTGGAGTIMFTISGLLLMTGAVGYRCIFRRKRERRNE